MQSIVRREPKESAGLPVEYLGFLARYENSNTQKIVHHNISHFLQFLSAAGYYLSSVDQNIINIYLNYLRKKGLSNATYNLNVSNIKKFLEYNGKAGFDFKTQKAAAYEHTRLVSESGFKNIVRFLEARKNADGKKKTKYLRDYILFNVLYLTGLRKNEVISLRHDDISLEAGQYVYQARLKRGKEIKKQFPANLIAAIDELKKAEGKSGEDYIFTSIYTGNKEKLSNRALNKVLNYYYAKVNGAAETVTVHSIRNLSGFKVYQITKDILKTQQHLNHSHLNTTQIYLEKLQSKQIDYYNELAGALN